MKTTLAIALLLALAQETPAPEPQSVPAAPPKDTSPLVEAAKAAKASRSKSSKRKVITNDDVKRSTGKLYTYTPPPLPELPPEPAEGPLARYEAQRKARIEAEVAVAAAEKKVTSLEKDLRALELSFYEENDPNYRDGVIQQRFDQTKRQLDEARRELAATRDALDGLTPKTPVVEVVDDGRP